jgi:hypothetical protein
VTKVMDEDQDGGRGVLSLNPLRREPKDMAPVSRGRWLAAAVLCRGAGGVPHRYRTVLLCRMVEGLRETYVTCAAPSGLMERSEGLRPSGCFESARLAKSWRGASSSVATSHTGSATTWDTWTTSEQGDLRRKSARSQLQGSEGQDNTACHLTASGGGHHV